MGEWAGAAVRDIGNEGREKFVKDGGSDRRRLCLGSGGRSVGGGWVVVITAAVAMTKKGSNGRNTGREWVVEETTKEVRDDRHAGGGWVVEARTEGGSAGINAGGGGWWRKQRRRDKHRSLELP